MNGLARLSNGAEISLPCIVGPGVGCIGSVGERGEVERNSVNPFSFSASSACRFRRRQRHAKIHSKMQARKPTTPATIAPARAPVERPVPPTVLAFLLVPAAVALGRGVRPDLLPPVLEIEVPEKMVIESRSMKGAAELGECTARFRSWSPGLRPLR